eukprot:1160869-Pelagomonas_calceolata.AAC.2
MAWAMAYCQGHGEPEARGGMGCAAFRVEHAVACAPAFAPPDVYQHLCVPQRPVQRKPQRSRVLGTPSTLGALWPCPSAKGTQRKPPASPLYLHPCCLRY